MKTKTMTMPERRRQTRRLTMLAIFLGLELLLQLTPLGFVPIGPIRATTLHLPVIMAGVMLGTAEGAGLGLVFGLSSLITNTVAPTITSFVFSPFYSLGEFHGNAWSVWIAIGPRVLLGVFASLIFQGLQKVLKNGTLAAAISAGVSTFLHTVLVMGSIYLFFGKEYAAAKNMTESALLSMIGTVIMVNGVAELILAALVVAAVWRVTSKSLKKADER